jgi:hypothetical protein
MRAFAVLFVLIVGLATAARADTGAALHISTDVIKPVLGLPNLEVEVQLDRHMTAHVFGEMLMYDTGLAPKDHPEGFARAGFRYFLWDFMDTTRASGVYGGIGAGAVFATLKDRPAAAVTAEAGYKLVLFETLQIMPRVMATVPLDGAEPLPGFELMIGAVL